MQIIFTSYAWPDVVVKFVLFIVVLLACGQMHFLKSLFFLLIQVYLQLSAKFNLEMKHEVILTKFDIVFFSICVQFYKLP